MIKTLNHLLSNFRETLHGIAAPVESEDDPLYEAYKESLKYVEENKHSIALDIAYDRLERQDRALEGEFDKKIENTFEQRGMTFGSMDEYFRQFDLETARQKGINSSTENRSELPGTKKEEEEPEP